MSVTEQQQPGSDDNPDGDPRNALRDRIAADPPTTRRDYLRIVATVSGGLAVGGLGVAGGILRRHGARRGSCTARATKGSSTPAPERRPPGPRRAVCPRW
ncbi:hypothetical protein F558DRAFT_06125 [Streptomyces sp. AmelKG-A3]|nr:hypothetical protein GA0115247_102013 [Streptomyces sp. PalvLS-984]SDE36869.1 hypothetical protein F558DRAFT_06125 [Streptomyces sp. AmelKG-A3]